MAWTLLAGLTWMAAGPVGDEGERASSPRARPSPSDATEAGDATEAASVEQWFATASAARRDGGADGRARALEAYGQVLRHARGHPRAAEAAFRRAEILRADERFDEAARTFAEAERIDPEGTFGQRARLERAHVARRCERFEEALRLYARVFGDARDSARQRARAAFWTGRTQAERGRSDDARVWFEWVAEHARDPVLRLRGFDEWMLAFVRTGDLEAAAGVLARARVSVANELRERTEIGARTRRALDNLRGPRVLESAVHARVRAR